MLNIAPRVAQSEQQQDGESQSGHLPQQDGAANPFKELPVEQARELAADQAKEEALANSESVENEFRPTGISNELKIRGELPGLGGSYSEQTNDRMGSESVAEGNTDTSTAVVKTISTNNKGFEFSGIHPGVWVGIGAIGFLLFLWVGQKLLKQVRRRRRRHSAAQTFEPVTNRLKGSESSEHHSTGSPTYANSASTPAVGLSGAEDFGAAILEYSESTNSARRSQQAHSSRSQLQLAKTSATKEVEEKELLDDGPLVNGKLNSSRFISSSLDLNEDDFDIDADHSLHSIHNTGFSKSKASFEAGAPAFAPNLEAGESGFDLSEFAEERSKEMAAESQLENSNLASDAGSGRQTCDERMVDVAAEVLPLSKAMAALASGEEFSNGDADEFDMFDGAAKEAALVNGADKPVSPVNAAAEIQLMGAKIQSLTDALSGMQADRDQLVAAVSEFETRVCDREELSKALEEIEDLKTAREELAAEKSRLQQSLEQLKSNSVEQSELDSAENEIAKLKSELARTKTELDIKVQTSVDRKELVKAQEEITWVKLQLAEAKSDLVKGQKDAAAKVRSELEASSAAAIEELETTLDETLATKEKLKKKLRATLAKLEKINVVNAASTLN